MKVVNARAGLLALVAAAASWGMTIVLIRFSSDELGVASLTSVEAVAAAVALLAALLITGRRLPRPSRPLLVISALEPGVSYVMLNYGIAHTSGTHASLIIGTESAFVIILIALRTRSRPAWTVVAGLVLATSGAVLLAVGGTGRASLRGDLFVVVGILAAAGYVVLVREVAETMGALELTAGQFVYGAFVTIPVTAFCAVTGLLPAFDWAPSRFVVAAVAVGVLGSAIAFVIYNWAMTRTGPGVSAISLTLIPVFGVVFSTIFLGDELSARTAIAALLVLSGIAIISRAEAREQSEATRSGLAEARDREPLLP